VKQKKEPGSFGGIFAVEHPDPGLGPIQQRLIARHHRLRGVAEIRQQREVDVPVAIREMVNLQGFDQPVHAGRVREHRRDDHHRAALRDDAGGIVEAREQPRLHEQRREPVHRRHGQLAGAEQEDETEENERRSRRLERARQPGEPDGAQ